MRTFTSFRYSDPKILEILNIQDKRKLDNLKDPSKKS